MLRQKVKIVSVVLAVLLGPSAIGATLSDIQFSELPGERAEVRLTFDSLPEPPTGYAIEQPARVVLDFNDVTSGLVQKKYSMSVGEVNSAVVVEGGGRTRLIVNLDNSAPYRAYPSGNEYVVEIGGQGQSQGASDSSYESDSSYDSDSYESVSSSAQISEPVRSTRRAETSYRGNSVQDIDFRRGEGGEGKVIVSLANTSANIAVESVSSGILVKLLNVSLPSELSRKLDVVDFATPVNMINSQQSGGGTVIAIDTQGEYDYSAYQADNEYVVSVRPLTRLEKEEKKKEFAYTGDRLSLNFQNIPVRNVLQLIADFTKLNLVASDTVQGSITLRLENVPWDQALDIVLKTKGLDKRQIGNVLMVAPSAEIAERERQEIETQKQLQELAPLRTEYIRVRYANASELFSLFVEASGSGGGGGGGGAGRTSTGTILSERGQAIVDERTNSIILTDTEEKIDEFKRLVDQIDIPIRQVMIEARIVRANTDFRKELGSRITGAGANGRFGDGGNVIEGSGSMEGLFDGDGAPATAAIFNDGVGGTIQQGNSTMVDLAAINPAGSFAIDLISSNFLLGLELSALQSSGFAEVVSQPKVITGDKQKASIQSGDEVGYQEESASGGTTTAFKEATLKLEVTPQITPDNKVIMDLSITQDSFDGVVNGIPTLAITQLDTKVLVSDGETIVLGGIYTTENVTSQTKVPLLGDIPFLGRLFRRDTNRSDKQELLLFITPKIMASDFVE